MAVSAPQLYKVLAEDGSACHGGSGRWTRGRWRSVRGELVACRHGLHVVTVAQLPAWLGPAIWRVEVRGELIDAGDKMVARRARITERVAAWDERTARLFAADCAERVLPVFERERPGDNRPREAIAVARRFANSEATREELAAARAAAESAAWAARAKVAARDAAWAARAKVAARAAESAARAAARAAGATWAVTWAAWAAWDAWDAAGAARAAGAAGAVTWAAWNAWDAGDAGDAARAAAEAQWQGRHLAEMLGLPWDVES